MEKLKKSSIFCIISLFGFSALIGAALGAGLSETENIKNTEMFTDFESALPTKLVDINGELITEFSSDEKREIININDLPQHMLDALLTREDRIFYSHKGFSYKALSRAIVGKLTGKSLGGGSTLSQQIAGTLYCDRTDMSIGRKLRELWWAIQMERRYSKNEILELYMNKIYFGGGTYGVNAASKYYFGHSAKQITPAEAAILVIQLSNPAFYNPFDHTNIAMERQKDVLDSMVKEGYLTAEEAQTSYDDYWGTFDYTRTNSSAYFMRDDKARWFSEYVRRTLNDMTYGSQDIYTSGWTVNTTLNLSHQQAAQKVMEKYITRANYLYNLEHSSRSNVAYKTYIPMAELLSLVFNIPQIKVSEQRTKSVSNTTYLEEINPILDLLSTINGMENLKLNIINKANSKIREESEKTTIEGTMICIENNTGYITSIVGGSKYDQDNQFIRAVQAKLQPGSTFKPLYYTEAIDSKKFTPTSIISDTPVAFQTADGGSYIPQNFRGEWLGDVPLYYALIHSMNVPSLKILDKIGFEDAINRAVSLLGISEEELPSRGFTPGYPIGLGVCSVRPIELARAYSVIASGGKAIKPIAIRSVEDRNGNTIKAPEKEQRELLMENGSLKQVLSPQTAYVMTKLLEQTVQSGTLRAQKDKFVYKAENGQKYTMPAAGKTGTTQNWADAWTSGFSPYYTSTFWFGFDKPGQSLGLYITGATLAGFAWGDYMREIHRGMIAKDFPTPSNGYIKEDVCYVSGKLPTPGCENYVTSQVFLYGTQPTETCHIHADGSASALSIIRLQNEMYQSGQRANLSGLNTSPLTLNLDFLKDDNFTGIVEEQTNTNYNFNKEDEDDSEYNFLLD